MTCGGTICRERNVFYTLLTLRHYGMSDVVCACDGDGIVDDEHAGSGLIVKRHK